MANSDSVLRGGLTSKHVDIKKFLETVSFNEYKKNIILPELISESEVVYKTPAEEFELSKIVLKKNKVQITQRSAEILLCTSGYIYVKDLNGNTLNLSKGDSIFVPEYVKKYFLEGEAEIYRASVPD